MMYLEGIMLTVVSQTKTITSGFHLYVEYKKQSRSRQRPWTVGILCGGIGMGFMGEILEGNKEVQT